jgi:hypothetical protein
MCKQEYFYSLNYMKLQRCCSNYSAAAFVVFDVQLCQLVLWTSLLGNLTLQPTFVSTSLGIENVKHF